jgi:hypothetical protein
MDLILADLIRVGIAFTLLSFCPCSHPTELTSSITPEMRKCLRPTEALSKILLTF